MDFYKQKLVMWFALFMIIIMLTACSPFSINTGVGVAYLPNVPEKRLTGNEQFYFKLEIEKPITANLSLKGEWDHYSNGAQLGIGRYPNRGLDLFNTHIEYKFNF